MYTPYITDTAILCVIALFAVRLQIIVKPPFSDMLRSEEGGGIFARSSPQEA